MPFYAWRCECGEEFPEHGFDDPGNDAGWRDATAHVAQHKKNGEPEKLVGLFRDGEMIYEGGSRLQAVAAGVIPKAAKKNANILVGRDGMQDLGSSNPYRGAIVAKNILIDPAVIICFEEARLHWPIDYPDDSPETISKFITETVLAFFQEHKDKLTMGKVLEQAVLAILAKTQETQGEGK